jgi:hypothetical protein
MGRHFHLLAERGYETPVGKNGHPSKINLRRQAARRSFQQSGFKRLRICGAKPNQREHSESQE